MGGEIGQIQYLSYEKAFVELNLGYYDSENKLVNAQPGSKLLQRDRFHALTVPLKGITSSDLAFGDAPAVKTQYADAIGYAEGNLTQGFTQALPDNTPLTQGFGFAYSVDGVPGNQNQLNVLQGCSLSLSPRKPEEV
jgi:hypothetical protein